MTRIAAAVITSYITGERSMAKYTGRRDYPTHDEIAQSAYHTYETAMTSRIGCWPRRKYA